MEFDSPKKVMIVGGGISGLATAYYLLKGGLAPQDLQLLESSKRLGGIITTETTEHGLLDGGPDSFITSKPWGLELCRELGLENELLATRPENRHLYFLKDHKLHRLPDGLFLGVPTEWPAFLTSPSLSWSVKSRMLREVLMTPRKNGADCSVADFFSRHFGREALDILFEPILAGIYAASATSLSLHATFPKFLELEERYGSVIRGLRKERKNGVKEETLPVFCSLKSGMGQLIRVLEQKLPQESLKRSARIEEIRLLPSQEIELNTSSGLACRGHYLVLATPVGVTRRLLRQESALANVLQKFNTASTATVFLAFRRQDIKRACHGFGFVVPRREENPLLACTWITSKFSHRSPESTFLLRCFVGGPDGERYLVGSDQELFELVQRELKATMGITAEPLLKRIFRWPNLSPQYSLGQEDNVRALEQELQRFPGLRIIGNAYRGVGIPDCIRNAKETAQNLLAAINPTLH